MDVWDFVIVFGVVFVFGFGFFFFIWWKTKRNKLSWRAEIYTLQSGIMPPITDRKGNIVSDFKLKGLKFLAHDYVDKIETKENGDVYKLRGADLAVMGLPTNCEERIPLQDNPKKLINRVRVLIVEHSATFLNMGYDEKAGVVFQPMEADRMNMVVTQIALRKERLYATKSLLEKILPWIVVGILVFGMLGVSWLHGKATYDIAEVNKEASMVSANAYRYAIDKFYNMTLTDEQRNEVDLGKQKPLGIQ